MWYYKLFFDKYFVYVTSTGRPTHVTVYTKKKIIPVRYDNKIKT